MIVKAQHQCEDKATREQPNGIGAERFAEVDENGRLVLPPELAGKFGLIPGERVYITPGRDSLRLHRPLNHIARLYVELTTRCNMDCPMCQRHTWTQPPADMTDKVIDRILTAIARIQPKPAVVLGGFGEPLVHPQAMDFIKSCRQLGAPVELISNGLLLNQERMFQLIDQGVERLWLSVDGVSEDCFGHNRMQGGFKKLLENLSKLTIYKYKFNIRHLKIGFVFVAMKDNIDQFPQVLKLARNLNVDQLLVSNLLPYTGDGLDRILYNRSTWKMNDHLMRVRLSRMDLDGDAVLTIFKALGDNFLDVTDISDREYGDPLDTCPFIKKGSVSIGWDGRVSPCPPLLHTHSSFFQGVERRNRECVFGSLEEMELDDVWRDEVYTQFRKRVMAFDFTPCVSCASCEWAESNEEDCFGNPFPTCGGCLWAQGLIQCP